MQAFSTSLIKTDVTSVQICRSYVLSGIGSYVHVHKLGQPELLLKQQIFKGLRIYGIHMNTSTNRVLFRGENVLKLCRIDLETNELETISSNECNDWILDARWIDSDSKIATISMHGVVNVWNNELQLVRTSECEERCILYCAKLSCDERDDLLVLSGTVFSEILVWKPDRVGRCPVLSRLRGHDGVLFSIDHDPNRNRICSTSDDRSVIIWEHRNTRWDVPEAIDVSLVHKLRGHTARVFGCKALKDHVISTGEDGVVNVWNLDGTLLKKIDAHQGGSIWCLDVKGNVLVTGGTDSAVTVFPLRTTTVREKLRFPEDTPKKLALLRDNHVVLVTERGFVYRYDEGWKLISRHEELKSYSLLVVSDCRSQFALAGFKGHIFLYRLINGELSLTCAHQTPRKDRIFSIHWLSCVDLLTCGPDGILRVWRHETRKFLPLHVMQLPEGKERWSTSAVICEDRVAIGDRKGNVHLFSLHEFAPIYTLRKAHDYLGVSKLYYEGNTLISLGRNSVLRRYKLDASNTSIVPLSSDKLPFSWLTSLKRNLDTSLLVAFSGASVVFWDYTARRILLEIECGGGHRSSDYNQNGNDVTFAYIKGKAVERIKCQWDAMYAYDLIVGINTDEINSLRCFRGVNRLYLISGGEDTTLRVSRWEKSSFVQFCVLKSHLSSIRCLHLLKMNDSCYLLFSAGGRAQIIMWQIENEITCNEIFSFYEPLVNDESETRVMDLCTTYITNLLFLLAACSDGKIKFYAVLQNTIEYVTCLQYELKCILKVGIMNDLLISMATDGFLVFWDFSAPVPFYRHKTNKSGVNCFSIIKYDDGSYVILTGGDDNAFTLSCFSFSSRSSTTSDSSLTKFDSPPTAFDLSCTTLDSSSTRHDCSSKKLDSTSNKLDSTSKQLDSSSRTFDSSSTTLVSKSSSTSDTSSKIRCVASHTNSETHCAQITGVHLTPKFFLSVALDKKLTLFSYSIRNCSIETRFLGAYDTSISDVKGMEVFETEDKFEVTLYGLGIQVVDVKK